MADTTRCLVAVNVSILSQLAEATDLAQEQGYYHWLCGPRTQMCFYCAITKSISARKVAWCNHCSIIHLHQSAVEQFAAEICCAVRYPGHLGTNQSIALMMTYFYCRLHQ